MSRRRPATGWVLLPVLALLAGCVGTAPVPAATEPAHAPAPASVEVGATPATPAPKYHYHARETVTGAYITTDGQPTAITDGWATTPASEAAGTWYAYGSATETLTIESTATVTRIVWVLPDGSQRVQEGDLTYYNPETGEYE